MKTNNLKEWAKREIDLATTGTDTSDEKNELNRYYKAAYLAFCDFVDRVEGLKKPGVVKTILTQLLHENPITPIDDNEEDWELWSQAEGLDLRDKNAEVIYQCRRRPSLFKRDIRIGEKRSVQFSDANRAVSIEINTQEMYTGGIGLVILDEMMPIVMPYQPLGKIKIFTEEIKFHKDTEDLFDTIGILYFKMPNDNIKKVDRFFKKDPETHELVEIIKEEYLYRKKHSKKRGLSENE